MMMSSSSTTTAAARAAASSAAVVVSANLSSSSAGAVAPFVVTTTTPNSSHHHHHNIVPDHQHGQNQNQQFSPTCAEAVASPPSEQLCYVHCTFCETVLAVSVPCSSLFKTVTVRCGRCSNLLSVNMRALLLQAPSPPNQIHLGHTSNFFPSHQSFLEELRNSTPNMTMNNQAIVLNDHQTMALPFNLHGFVDQHHHQEIPKPPVVNRPPEKRQRVPSAYNRFIKDEIQRIKAGNPDISHREAFSAAAKNWAHFPHIHFGLMPDQQPAKKANVRQQEAEENGAMMMKDGFLAAAASTNSGIGLAPY